ncbi:phage major capsid family protein [Streptococcus respiraculi]|uniref:phage major capsid family protein n=1 Tax=Streptococcus respiraculi TaxID=2021971 RepID=UPI000E753764|nr:phage major capsid protein [Streptococcus respiraculi]
MSDSLKQGTLYTPDLITDLISKVQGSSVLAKLANQTPIPFAGVEQFVFNLEGNAQIVGEGEQKGAGKATMASKVIKPLKFVYQARITDEFKNATTEKQIAYMQAFNDGFAKIIARSFDLAALHGLEPKTMTDASFKATNSFDGVIDGNVVTFSADKIEDNIESAVAAITAKGGEVTGLALSPTAGQALAKIKVNGVAQYPEFRFGQNPDSFYGMKSDVNKNLTTTGGTAKKDHVIVGDFQNRFKWGYAENIPLEIIEYGDPDQTGRDLKAYNEICLRTEVFIGWGILDKDSFARVEEA